MAFKDLFKPKWKNSNPQIREEAIKKINDKILLERIAKSDQEYRIRQIAYTKLGQGSSSMSLADIAKHDQSLDTRIEAIEKINDSKILFNLSSYDNSSDNLEYFQKLRIRGAATRKINDQQMLVDIAYNSNNSDIRKIAVRKINDQEVLV